MTELLDTTAFGIAIEARIAANHPELTPEQQAGIVSTTVAAIQPKIDEVKANLDANAAKDAESAALIDNLQAVIKNATDKLNPSTGSGTDVGAATAALAAAPQ